MPRPSSQRDILFIERARCPACGSDNLQSRHSQDQGDGSVVRDTKCRECGHVFSVVEEWPQVLGFT